MLFPDYRPRRLRQNEAFRRMIRETALSVDDLILPLFTIGGKNIKNPIPSMPGHFQLSIDNLIKTCKEAYSHGVPAVMLFGVPDSKDAMGTGAYAQNGICSACSVGNHRWMIPLIVQKSRHTLINIPG
jgi:porphobilinogen synthase